MENKLINSVAEDLLGTIYALPEDEKAQIMYQAFMNVVGIPHSEHSEETAKRVTKFFTEYVKGFGEPDFNITTFKDERMKEQIVTVKNVEFYSLCAHHHLPFYGTADFSYVSDGTIVGLSKIPRIIQHVAKKPTTQEDLTKDIVELFRDTVNPIACGVTIRAKHMCMSMRGIRNQGSETFTHHLDGTREFFIKEVRKALGV